VSGHHPHRHGEASSRGHSHGDAFESAGAAAHLEVEGELSAGVAGEAIAVCAGLLDDAGVEVRRVIDLGCGPGVATGLLAQAFASASVVAVDGSAAMLERAGARARRLGLAGRIETRRLDLDGDLAGLGRCDLAWAAMAVHHAQDEVATLRRIRSLLDPGGLVCVLERADPTSIRLADDLGRPGIWDRLETARAEWFESVRERMPGAMNAGAYAAMLAAAGLQPVADRTLTGTLDAPADAATHQFVAGQLDGAVRDLAGVAADRDLDALRALVGRTPPFPDGSWPGTTVTSSRTLLVARPAPS
jgi:SAM-dependent methyltransferase